MAVYDILLHQYVVIWNKADADKINVAYQIPI